MLAPDKMSHLLSTKEDKLNTLSEKTYDNQDLTRDSYTDLGDGYIENNGNKIWGISEDWSPEEMAFARDYLTQNYSLPSEARGDRRFYEYGVKDEGSFVDPNQAYQPENYDPRKFGLSTGKKDTSDARYLPEMGGYAPGPRGVDINRNYEDTNLAYGAATALESLVHTNRGNFGNRLVRERADGLYDYDSPQGLITITKDQKDEMFGSGASEYYRNHNSVFADSYNAEDIDQAKIIEGLNKAMSVVAGEKYDVPLTNEEETARLGEIADKYTGIGERLGNTLKGFGATFVDSLIVSPADAIGDLTGWYDIGNDQENTAAVNKLFGYDDRFQQRAMERIGTQWEKLADSDAPVAERMRAAGNGILEAFLTPELLGTSFGALASWITPGVLLKAVGVGSKFANSVKAIDAAVDAGTMTKAAARAAKAQQFFSIPGAKAALANQSGFMVSAMGEVNKQYNQFVANNNGVELEGADKAKWFAGRFAVQMLNQNLDKITDFSILKNPGMIAAVVPAVKAMTNKEFANVATMMGKGVLVTGQNMGKEAAQEYSQTMMELFNSRYGSKKFEDVEEFTAFLADERNTTEAGIAALAGAGGAGQFELAGSIGPAIGLTGQAAGAIGQKIKDTKSTTPAADTATVEESDIDTSIPAEEATAAVQALDTSANKVAAKYGKMFSDDEIATTFTVDLEDQADVPTPTLDEALKASGSSYADIVAEIESAELTIEKRTGTDRATPQDDLALVTLRKAKAQAAKVVMESEEPPTLGSGYSVEDVVDDFLNAKVSVDGNLDITEDEKALVNDYLQRYGQKPYRFENIKTRMEGKDAAAVYDDSMGVGKNSAPNRRARLKELVNTPNVSKAAIKREIDGIRNFLSTQLDRKAAYEVAKDQLQKDINTYNKNLGKAGSAVKPKKVYIEGTDKKNYIDVFENADGTFKIRDSSNALINSIDDTIDHLETTLNRYKKATTKIVGNEVSGEFIDVPANTDVKPEAQKAREDDATYYKKRNVTKAIVDKDNSPKWWLKGGDYFALNESKIVNASSEFTPDDVVLLTTLDFKKGSSASQTLAKALKAGAKVVVDRGVAKNSKDTDIRYLAARYQGGYVDVNGIKYILPRAEAVEAKKVNREKANTKRRSDRVHARLVDAFDEKMTAKADNVTQDKKAKESFDRAVEAAKEFFTGEGNIKNMREYAQRILKEETEKAEVELEAIMLKEGTSSKAYSEALGKYRKTAARIADKNVKVKENKYSQGGKLVTAWKDAEAVAKKGGKALTEWVKETFGKDARKFGKELIADSLGSSLEKKGPYYAYLKKDSTTFSITTRLDEAKNFSADGTYQVIEVDPSKYLQVTEATVFNTLSVEEMMLEGTANVLFNEFVESAVGNLENTLGDIDLGRATIPFDLIDSPAASLIFNADEQVNANIAVAMKVALYNFIRNNGYLMGKEFKSEKDVAEMLGKHESELSDTAYLAMQDKGLLFKTAADSVGKDIAALMGLKPKTDNEVDAQLFNALATELGQIALLTGVQSKEGLLTTSSMSSKEFAKEVLGKSSIETAGADSKINFIEIADKDKLEDVQFAIDVINNTLPKMDVRRKEPSFTPLTKEEKEAATKKIKKEKLGITAATKSKEGMELLMDTEMVANMPLLRKALAEKDRIMKLLGWIDLESNEFKKLSYKEQQTQASKNRDIERNFEHLTWLNENTDSKENKVSMWFKYFFSKNGRFFVDSNTINPQTNKHLDRFFVQPKDHYNTFTRIGKKFFVGKQDVTANVFYALAQGFGFATDKKYDGSIEEFSRNVLTGLNTKEKLEAAREEFLNTGKVESLGIKIEHLGHALQAFDFIEQMLTNPNKFESAITAEFDAVTSGFALKLLQMPIIGKKLFDWLGKVGIVRTTDENLSYLGDEKVSMNNLLDLKGITKNSKKEDQANFLDSYQFLASSIKAVDYETLQKNSQGSALLNASEGYPKNLWGAVSRVLPTVDPEGGISSDLRNLFKYPFMTFNYASSIKSIRQRLKGTMKDDIAKAIAKLDLNDINPEKEKDVAIVDMLKQFAESEDIKVLEALQEQVRSKDLDYVKVGKGASLGLYLDAMIDASYGVQVEQVLTDEFSEFVAAQDAINNSFKAMFEVFIVSFEQKLQEARKNGAVSAEKEKQIYESLKDQWPAIKGPLNEMEAEFSGEGGIGVYSLETASPYGAYSGRKAAVTKLSEDLRKELSEKGKLGPATMRTSHMIKSLGAAISAGSVIPIHYIDGAIMNMTLMAMGGNLTSVHDAIIPSLLKMGIGQKSYNKAVMQVSATYSFVDEIVKSLDRMIDSVDLFNADNSTPYQKAKVKVSRTEEMSAASYLISTRNVMAAVANDVNAERERLFEILNEGAYVMHMAGTADGVHTIDENSRIEYKPIDRYKQIKDNTVQKPVNGVTEKDLNDLAKNHCS